MTPTARSMFDEASGCTPFAVSAPGIDPTGSWVQRELTALGEAWRRSGDEAVLPRRPVTESTGIKVKADKASQPPQGITLLSARIDTQQALVAAVIVTGEAAGRQHPGPWNDPAALLGVLWRWQDDIPGEALDGLRSARRGLLRALDGADHRPGIVACPDLDCTDAQVMLRAQRYAFGLICPACGRQWTGEAELAGLRRLVGEAS